MFNRRLVLAFKTLLAEAIKWALSPPSKPGAFALTVLGEVVDFPLGEPLMKKNITTITLPAVKDDGSNLNVEGVVTRKFNIKSGDAVLFDQALPLAPGKDNVDPIVVKLPQGVETTLTLIDVDQAGNESEADIFVFTPSDVTAPSKPGSFAMTVSGEVDE